ncbi:2-amino-4-hydroxy-6-hydroxymethyldihydropteridine diphosphokinase [Hallella bergensis]|uniref:2-amino-4-hydroxy-6- hydroxymethyldihydropteridine diphosphokinase n=1 Tax=Hallella bergensis TaxID=242750 RepID=UPI0039907E1B
MQTDRSHMVYLGLGSNIGNRRQLIGEAVTRLGERVGRVVRQSSLIETEPWGFDSPNRFLNSCVACRTALTPHEVLAATKQVEKEMGRMEKTRNGEYHDRTIDIDILLYDDIRMDEPGLVIPHPRMQEREFVMKPLREIRDY